MEKRSLIGIFLNAEKSNLASPWSLSTGRITAEDGSSRPQVCIRLGAVAD